MAEDTKAKLWLNVTKIILVLLAAAGLGGYSYKNHEETSKGYETLATAVNQSVLGRLDKMEDRVDSLERKLLRAAALLPASQPVAQDQRKPPRVVLPPPPADPYAELKEVLTKEARVKPAPRKAKRVPSQLRDVR